jgi:hypothetical protein
VWSFFRQSSAAPLLVDDDQPARRHQLAVMQALILGVSLPRERFKPALEAYWRELQGRDRRAFLRVLDAVLAGADNEHFVLQHCTEDPSRPRHQQSPFCYRDCQSVEDVLRVLLAPAMGGHVDEGVWDSIELIRRHTLPGAVDDDAQRKALVTALVHVCNRVFHLRPITSADRRGMITVLVQFLRACNPVAANTEATLAAIERLKVYDDVMCEAELMSCMRRWGVTLREEMQSLRGKLSQRDQELLAKLDNLDVFMKDFTRGVCHEMQGIAAAQSKHLDISQDTNNISRENGIKMGEQAELTFLHHMTEEDSLLMGGFLQQTVCLSASSPAPWRSRSAPARATPTCRTWGPGWWRGRSC